MVHQLYLVPLEGWKYVPVEDAKEKASLGLWNSSATTL